MEIRQKKGAFRFLLPTLVILLLQTGVSFFFMELAVIIYTAGFERGGDYQAYMDGLFDALSNVDFLSWTSTAYAVVGVIVFGLWYKHIKPNDEVKKDDSLRHYSFLLYFGIILFACAAQYVCMYMIDVFAYLFPDWLSLYEEIMESAGLSGDNGYSLSTVVYAALVGPVCEELCYRGVTYQYARAHFPFWSANISQALLFGAMHMNPMQSAYAFLVGLAFGAIYEKTRNIKVSILVHIAFNGCGILLENYMSEGDTPVVFYLTLFTSLCATYFGYILIARAEDSRTLRLARQSGTNGDEI